MRINQLLIRLFRDEEGQTTTEYILILAVVVMIAMRFRRDMGDRLTNIVGELGNRIENEITTMQ